MNDDFDYSAFTGQFVAECCEHLETMNKDLLVLEQDPENTETHAEMVREAHTIKGAAKMMGAEEIAELAHKMEDLFGEVKENRVVLGPDLADQLFKALDGLDNLLKAFAGEKAQPADADALTKALDAYMPGASKTAKSKPSKAAEKETGARVAAESKKEAKPAAKRSNRTGGREETIRVSAKKLDDLSNLTGELVIHYIRQRERETTVKRLIDAYKNQELGLRALQETVRGMRLPDPYLPELERLEEGRQAMAAGLQGLYRTWREDDTQMGMLIDQLTREVLGARMVPVSVLFDTFARPVRDLGRQFGKEIEMKIEGGDTELDRRMIEVMQDPMIHMIRNAIDHGLEKPEERKAAGKPKAGRLVIKAKHEGEYIVIEMEDDGAGLDLDKVKQKAIKKKIVSVRDAERMTEAELVQLLFKPGFSTSDIITDISGRGVGMDVIKTKIEELKGMVYLKTEKGKGTTVIIKVPLTLAMSRVMFVRAAGQMLAIPTTSVDEAIRIRKDDIKTVEGRQAVVLREHAVPLISLSEVLGIKGDRRHPGDKIPVVILNLAGTRMGLIIDELIGEHEVVIKALGSNFKNIRNVSGATILGSGEVVLVLNPPDIVGAAAAYSPEVVELEPRDETEERRRQRRILVVDDSSTTRELEKGILLSAGYAVDEAVDGVDAMAKVKKKKYDLLVVDVQMPRMDGLTLTRRLKSDERYTDIPVIIVTTLEKEEDKRRGIDAGADAYIIKRAFDQANLLSVIAQLIAA